MIAAVLTVAAAIAFAYQLAALAAMHRHKLQPVFRRRFAPPISMLKPVYGLDEAFEEAIASHAEQDYGAYEILFGVHSLDDPAVPVIQALIGAHPERAIRLLVCETQAPNAKVGVLIDLAREARYPVLLVNDSDITVPRDYLHQVAAPLADPNVGLVTCLYRATANSAAGRWEALGIATDFMPSTLVAPLVGVKEFGLGSTLCFRRDDLDAIGGFESVADHIADDYQLARRITATGKRAFLSHIVVETHLSDPGWRAVWRHQVRWARTIRVSRGDGYLGLPVTHAGVWSLVCFAAGLTPWAAILWLTRVLMGVTSAWGVLHYHPRLLLLPLLPLWDVWAFAVWLAAFSNRPVEWRGRRITLARDGRITFSASS